MTCEFCGGNISNDRIVGARRGKGHLKELRYCSNICIKRAWHYKKNPLSENSKSSATYKGRKWEKYAVDFFKGSEYKNKDVFNNEGYDILWNGVKIDVKSKEFNEQWSFSRENSNTDFYFLVCLVNGSVYKTLFIPSACMGKSGITIGKKSGHDKFLIKTCEDILLAENI